MGATPKKENRSELTPETICQEADRIVSGDRQDQYGHPLDDYTRTTRAFNELTGHNLTAEDGITFMIIVKMSRERHKPKRDNRVDAVGYMKCLDMTTEERKRRA